MSIVNGGVWTYYDQYQLDYNTCLDVIDVCGI